MSASATGRKVGNYRFEEMIGEGGVGEVYRATDLLLDRTVAIKALRADLAARNDVVERFRAEAQTLAQLNHPNIATLYSLVLEDEQLYMVMEFVSGRTFAALLKEEGPMPPGRALPLFFEALGAIGYAHDQGFVHRDVKAANVMLDDRGQVKVMDFGIARALGSSRATEQGHLVGTLPYMSPEQIRGDETDARADIYSLGVLLFHLLTGRVPFARRSDYEVMRAHVELEPPPPRHFVPGLSPALEAVVLRALAKEPDQRFGTTAELREALESAAAIEVLGDPTREQGITATKSFEATVVLVDDEDAVASDPEPTLEHEALERAVVSGDAPTRRIERPEATSMRRHAWRAAAGLALVGLLATGANLLWIARDGDAPSSEDRSVADAGDSDAGAPSGPGVKGDIAEAAIAAPADSASPETLARDRSAATSKERPLGRDTAGDAGVPSASGQNLVVGPDTPDLPAGAPPRASAPKRRAPKPSPKRDSTDKEAPGWVIRRR
jgi:hypothetical protein